MGGLGLGEVLPAEADLATVARQQALVGNGYMVDVAPEVVEHAAGAVEGGFASTT